MIKVKSIFADPSDDDGFRVLVEPVWSRSASRERMVPDVWFRDLAPSPELYLLYANDQVKWEDFVVRYHNELDRRRGYFRDLQAYNHDGGLTIIHGSRNEDYNIAVAVKMFMEKNDHVTNDRKLDHREPLFPTGGELSCSSQKREILKNVPDERCRLVPHAASPG